MKKKIKLFLCIAAILLVTGGYATGQEKPYDGYIYNFWGESVNAPAGYVPDGVITGADIGAGEISTGQDLYVFGDKLYILDGTGLGRLIVLNSDMTLDRVLDAYTYNNEPYVMSGPQGVFVTEEYIYVADTGNKRGLAMTHEGDIKFVYERPDSDVLGTAEFVPAKIIADKSGNVYLVCTGIYQGFVNYTTEGMFVGFYGSNRVQMTLQMLSTLVFKRLLGDDTAMTMERFLPVEFSNAFVTGDFIYTVTRSNPNSVDEVQKLNPAGNNILKYPEGGTFYPKNNFGDIEVTTINYKNTDSQLIDIHVDEIGIISVLDQEKGRIFQYDQECNLACIFGGKGDYKGAFGMPTAIEKLGDKYIVLDKDKKRLVVFAQTEYMSFVREGLDFFRKGLYEESVEPWKKVLAYNDNFPLAYQSIGKSYLQRDMYKEAMDCFKKGQDRNGYSTAFRAYRTEVMRKYFIFLLLGAVTLVFVFFKVLRLIQRKLGITRRKRTRTISQ